MYVVVYKIFRTDVKIIKLTIRPIGHHHPQSSFLPNVDTGPTISFIFGTLPGSTLSDLAWISSVVSNRCPFSFNFILEIGRSHRVPNQGVWWVGMTDILYFVKNRWVMTEV
jgi:hypothetical protein